jgi:hypothetical protein
VNTARRQFLATAGAAFTSSIFTGQIKGANDRISLGFIGVGGRGFQNLRSAINEPNTRISAVCDVYQANLEVAATEAERNGHKPKSVADFRDVLADKSIDAVVISTPDHWHALMTVEACKAGKDVYVEKPVCTYIDEAPKMIQAMQKYKRVVQGGTNSRLGGHMPAIREVIQSGRLGVIASANVNLVMKQDPEGIGNLADSAPPPGLDWNMWLGPAQQRPYNQNRFWTVSGPFASFRYFWDYAGGNETDNGIPSLTSCRWLSARRRQPRFRHTGPRPTSKTPARFRILIWLFISTPSSSWSSRCGLALASTGA